MKCDCLRFWTDAFPDRDSTDEQAEALKEVFSLRAKEGESLRQWISRATEAFDKCERKAKVSFPEEARGYCILVWSGLSDEQQAVVKGRSLGALVERGYRCGHALLLSRLCDFVVPKRRAVAYVEETRGEIFDEVHPGEADGFEDVELMVADYVEDQDLDRSDDVFGEAEVAEVLAATWKEKRAEINKLQKARRFDAARDLKRNLSEQKWRR